MNHATRIVPMIERVQVRCIPLDGSRLYQRYEVTLDGTVIHSQISYLSWQDALVIAQRHLNPPPPRDITAAWNDPNRARRGRPRKGDNWRTQPTDTEAE